MKESQSKGSTLECYCFVDPEVFNIYGRLKWIIDRTLRLSEVEND